MAEIFNQDGSYNKTTWGAGDKITSDKLNKLEDALYEISDKVADGDLATKDFVTEAITQAQLGGDSGEIDLSNYATKYYVDDAIEAIELTPGPKGDKGDKGDTGKQGPAGQDGTTPVKGVDYFTEEDIASLNIPSIDGLATESFVNNAIANAQLGDGENGSIDLSTYATISYVDGAIETIELTPGPKGDKGDTGETGPEGPKGDTGETGPAGADGAPFTYDMFTEEQLEALRGPKGEQGEKGDKGDTPSLEGVISSDTVVRIEIVTALPETEEEGVLYFVKGE